MASLSNLKSYLFNPSRIFKTEAVGAVLWLIKRVYLFLTHSVDGVKTWKVMIKILLSWQHSGLQAYKK